MSDYAMFSEAGNTAVHGVVVVALQQGLNWPATYAMLLALGDDKQFEEAADTAVRECVYDACRFESAFYI
jgi:hypothetical protein